MEGGGLRRQCFGRRAGGSWEGRNGLALAGPSYGSGDGEVQEALYSCRDKRWGSNIVWFPK